MLQGKDAIITGARSGIGLATLQLFAQNGCNCWAIIHRDDPDFLNKIQALESEYNVWIKPIYMELDKSESIQQRMKDIFAEKRPIDILVNAAGVVSPPRLFSMTSMTDIRHLMEVNFFSAISICQYVSRVMMKQRSGSIINIASISAYGEDTSQMEYASSKAALICATKKISRELGPYGIRVNAIAPGVIETKMLNGFDENKLKEMVNHVSLKRVGRPEEIAEICLFLASDKSSYITGEIIKATGG